MFQIRFHDTYERCYALTHPKRINIVSKSLSEPTQHFCRLYEIVHSNLKRKESRLCLFVLSRIFVVVLLLENVNNLPVSPGKGMRTMRLF